MDTEVAGGDSALCDVIFRMAELLQRSHALVGAGELVKIKIILKTVFLHNMASFKSCLLSIRILFYTTCK